MIRTFYTFSHTIKITFFIFNSFFVFNFTQFFWSIIFNHFVQTTFVPESLTCTENWWNNRSSAIRRHMKAPASKSRDESGWSHLSCASQVEWRKNEQPLLVSVNFELEQAEFMRPIRALWVGSCDPFISFFRS